VNEREKGEWREGEKTNRQTDRQTDRQTHTHGYRPSYFGIRGGFGVFKQVGCGAAAVTADKERERERERTDKDPAAAVTAGNKTTDPHICYNIHAGRFATERERERARGQTQTHTQTLTFVTIFTEVGWDRCREWRQEDLARARESEANTGLIFLLIFATENLSAI
jgi:hypothetical protein